MKVLDILTHPRGHSPGLKLFLEAAEVSSEARHLRQSLDGVQGFIHLALAHFMGDHNDLGAGVAGIELHDRCLLYTSPSPRDKRQSRMPSSA